MKISLLYPRWTGEYGIAAHFARKASIWPPLNLAYISAVAEKQGHEAMIIDGEAERMSLEKMVSKTEEFNPDLIGITATTPFFHIVVDLAKKIKQSQKLKYAPIVLGGSHITVLGKDGFKDCFDYGFLGEAENSFPLFLDRFQGGGDISDVRGMLYRNNGEVRSTGYAESVSDVDSLPFPARHLLKMDKYKMGTLEGIKKFATVMTTRGCPFKCIFCSTKVFGSNVRRHSPERVVEEIKYCADNYGTEHFMFLDDTLTLSRKLIDRERLGITFEGSTRADLVDEELIARMRNSGLIRISFGLESVDENIRITMKKQVPLESYETANKLTNKYGIETLNSCMIGLPGESVETIRATLRFLRKSREIKQANISIAVPYPGTELYEMAKNGEHGLKLEIDDFSKFRRYNSAVMQVGDLSPEALIDLQKEAIASIYLAPWRWKPMISKSGLFGAALNFKRLIESLIKGNTRFLTNKQLGIN